MRPVGLAAYRQGSDTRDWMEIHTPTQADLDRDTLRRLSRRSDARGFVQLAAHGLLLGVTGIGVWASRGSLWFAPAIVLYGTVLSFVFCALHETVHRTAFASRRVNDAVAWVCGSLLLLPCEYFRLFHFEHHRFTQDPARDPELALAAPTTLRSYLWRMSGLPNWTKRITVTLGHALTGRVAETFVPEAKRQLIVREARVLWSLYLAVLTLSLLFRTADAFIYWILPVVAGQPFLRLYLFAEHAGCPFVDDMYANTRTTYTNAAVRLLAWQMPYHVEHHAFPSVPFHGLGLVNTLVRDRIEVSAPGYLAVHLDWIRRLRKTSARVTAP
jgi:fatty acid desaturase